MVQKKQRKPDMKLGKKGLKAIDDFWSPIKGFMKSKKFKRGY
jgi:hypothetical protein